MSALTPHGRNGVLGGFTYGGFIIVCNKNSGNSYTWGVAGNKASYHPFWGEMGFWGVFNSIFANCWVESCQDFLHVQKGKVGNIFFNHNPFKRKGLLNMDSTPTLHL